MPEPEVVRVMREHRAGLLRQEGAQMREMARRWLLVEGRLARDIEGVLAEIRRREAAGEVFGRDRGPYTRLNRYRALLAQTREEVGAYSRWAEQGITAREAELVRLAVAQGAQAIEAVGRGEGLSVLFDRLPADAVENMVATLADGAPLGDLLRQAWPDGAVRMTDALVNGVALGWNPRKTARAMREGLQKGALQRCLVIARTEQMRVYRQASLESYRASNVVVGYRRLSARDRRTCLACLFADGRFYRLDEEFDQHPNDRCTLLPVLNKGTPIDYETGQEWFVRQPVNVQREMLGPGRWELWQQGKVSLHDMVQRHENERWGGSLAPATVGWLSGLESGNGRPDARNMLGVSAAARRLQWEWVHSPSRQPAIVLKETLRRALGVEGIVINPKGIAIDNDDVRALEGTVREMYERTQLYLREHGVRRVRLYRGLKSAMIEPGVIESWTSDKNTAIGFNGFHVLEEDIPAERIFMSFLGPGWRNGRFGEQFEYLVLGSAPK